MWFRIKCELMIHAQAHLVPLKLVMKKLKEGNPVN